MYNIEVSYFYIQNMIKSEILQDIELSNSIKVVNICSHTSNYTKTVFTYESIPISYIMFLPVISQSMQLYQIHQFP